MCCWLFCCCCSVLGLYFWAWAFSSCSEWELQLWCAEKEIRFFILHVVRVVTFIWKNYEIIERVPKNNTIWLTHSWGVAWWGKQKVLDQFSSVTQLCLILCNPVDCSTPGFPVHHQFPELAQTYLHRVSDTIQPSHPLSSPSPPAFSLSQHQGLF